MYKIQTHRKMNEYERRNAESCELCGQPAAYWSQAGYPDGKLAGHAVDHCQRHRQWAREQAELSVPAIRR